MSTVKKIFSYCVVLIVVIVMTFSTIGPAHAQGVSGGAIQPYTPCSTPNVSAVGVDGKGYICLNGMWFRPQPLMSIATPEPGSMVRQCMPILTFICWTSPATPSPVPVPVPPVVIVPAGTPLPSMIPEGGRKFSPTKETLIFRDSGSVMARLGGLRRLPSALLLRRRDSFRLVL